VRIIALDYGAARIGCAICDPSETLARPLAVLEPPDPRAVAELVATHEAQRVVVGIPVHLNGRAGEQAEATQRFAGELQELLDIPVDTYDERLTTSMARASRRAGAEAPEDALAAAHLLEGYLASRRGKSEGDA
jgi:putative Holliday junction resolvase